MQTFEFGVFFFCKQKTAYEMRISDWSSDVCSSELLAAPVLNPFAPDTFVGEAGIGQGLIEGRADRRLLCIVEQLGIDCAPSAIDEPIEFCACGRHQPETVKRGAGRTTRGDLLFELRPVPARDPRPQIGRATV